MPVRPEAAAVHMAGVYKTTGKVAAVVGNPAMHSMAGRATVPGDHPNYVFSFGPAGDLARRETDVLLVVGSGIGNLDVPYDVYWGDTAGQRLIHIDIVHATSA